MHGLDDVAPDGQLAQSLLEAGFECPLADGDLCCETEAFEFHGAADQKPAQFAIFTERARPQIGDAGTIVGCLPQGAVKTCPAFGIHLLLERRFDLQLAARSKLQSHPFGGAYAKPG